MDYIQSLILGIVQGLTEYLPVSSSGHLQIGHHLLGLDAEGGLTFDILVHVATVLSTIVVLWKEIARVFTGMFKPLAPTSSAQSGLWNRLNEEQKYALKIIVSMIPIGIVGLLFKDWVEEMFGSDKVVGVCLLVTAVLLALTYYIRPKEKKDISMKDAFVIGLAQAAAVLPGLSRSGSTIATGLLLGNSRQNMAQFSFLMVIPPILGEALLDLRHLIAPSEEYLLTHPVEEAIPFSVLAVGFVAAFISGCVACKWMIALVKKCKLIYFAIYCALVGALTLILL